MDIFRNYDPIILNAIINHPEVRPHVGGDGESWIDTSQVLSNGANVCLLCEGGGGLFMHVDRATYEGHSFFLPGYRGFYAIRAAKAIFEHAAKYGIDVIYGETPMKLRACRLFNKRIGMLRVTILKQTATREESELTVFRR